MNIEEVEKDWSAEAELESFCPGSLEIKGKISEFLVQLKEENESKLVGQFESKTMEFKRQAYGLDSKQHKLELAKDVAALANSDGGIIVLGIATEKSPNTNQDRYESLKPISRDLIDIQRMRGILEQYLWPPQETKFAHFPSKNYPDKGYCSILVNKAPNDERPVLVRDALAAGENQKILGNYYAVFERRGSNVVAFDQVRLHSWLQAGRAWKDELRELVSQAINGPMPFSLPAIETIDELIDNAVEAARLEAVPRLVLWARPSKPITLDRIFNSEQDELVKLVNAPPQFRDDGFDLDLEESTKIINASTRRALAENYGALELHRDGTLLFAFLGNQGGLCWAAERRGSDGLLINQLSLAERTLLFFTLHQQLMDAGGNQDNPFCAGALLAKPGAVGDWELRPGPLRSSNHAKTYADVIRIDEEYGIMSPGVVTYKLLASIYNHFGFSGDRVPYASRSDPREVEEDLLKLDFQPKTY